jgi:Ankyrin repeats (3 copies)
MYIVTVSALCIFSLLNASQERSCNFGFMWHALGYKKEVKKTFHELVKDGTWEEIDAAIQQEKATRAYPYEQYDPFYDKQDANGYAPIHIAAQRGDADIILLLLQNSASATETTPTKLTPLHIAAQHGHLDAACMLLRADAKINAQDAVKNTALHYAYAHGHEALAAYLVNHCKAYTKALNRNNQTPIQCRPPLPESDTPEQINKT